MAKILVVDDDLSLLSLAQAVLTDAGHAVLVQRHAVGVVSLAEAEAVDAIILDVMLPERSGLEVLQELRRRPATSSVIVLVLSALTDGSDRVRGLRIGADDYLTKPLEPDELLLKLERLLASADHDEQPDRLSGSLEHFPLAEVLQSMYQGARSGTIRIEAAGSIGEIRLAQGFLVNASWQGLECAEAVWAMLALRQGRFLFVPGMEASSSEAEPGTPRISALDLVMHAAWIEDQLARRAPLQPDVSLLPVTTVDLQTRVGGDHAALPLATVAAAVEQQPGLRLAQLLQLQLAAPQRVHLAVAVLAENASVKIVPPTP